MIDLDVGTDSYARSATVMSFGFGCHALQVCFRVGVITNVVRVAARSLTKALEVRLPRLSPVQAENEPAALVHHEGGHVEDIQAAYQLVSADSG